MRTPDEIRAAGADAVSGWEIPDHVVEQLVTLISPVAADVQASRGDTAVDAAGHATAPQPDRSPAEALSHIGQGM
ncbi:hypothetical protein V2I01_04735 [Micromonospora sp. BRA006-A]|nr:hypothetical protein [Micromonospora sp. BRA006-A]